MKRFLFLDIDGVIAGDGEWNIMLDDKSCPFNREALDALEYIIKQYPATKIILSSAWRKGMEIGEIQNLFRVRKFKYWDRIIDKTVVLSFEKIDGKYVEWYMSVPRGCEIEQWIRTHTDNVDQYKYVILDDGSDMMYWQRDYFIHTRDHLLTMEDAKKAVEILK
jgi:hypothetical protein